MEMCRVRLLRLESHVIELRSQAEEARRVLETLRRSLGDVEALLDPQASGGVAAPTPPDASAGSGAVTAVSSGARFDREHPPGTVGRPIMREDEGR